MNAISIITLAFDLSLEQLHHLIIDDVSPETTETLFSSIGNKWFKDMGQYLRVNTLSVIVIIKPHLALFMADLNRNAARAVTMLKTVIQRVLDQVIADPRKRRKVTLYLQRGFTLNGNMTMLLVQTVALRNNDLVQSFRHIKLAGLLAAVRDGDLLEIIQ